MTISHLTHQIKYLILRHLETIQEMDVWCHQTQALILDHSDKNKLLSCMKKLQWHMSSEGAVIISHVHQQVYQVNHRGTGNGNGVC